MKFLLRRILVLAILLFSFTISSLAYEKNSEVILNFKHLIKQGDLEKLSKKVIYPLNRPSPIPPIVDAKDFINRFDVVFDENLIKTIVNSSVDRDWSAVGWRGMMLNGGEVWLDYEGNLIALNYLSALESAHQKNILKRKKNTLHPSVSQFDDAILSGNTKKFRIRVDYIDKIGYRYASWSIEKSTSDEPDIVLYSKDVQVEGTARNTYYNFYNKGYTYTVADIVLGEEEGKLLKVYKGEKLLLNEQINETQP